MTKKTRRRLLLVVIPLAVLMAAGAVVSMLVSPASAADDGPQPKYLLRRYDGMVAVFLPDSAEPEYVTDAPVSMLPAADRAAIETGLPVYSEEELTRFLEDYCS